MDVRLPDGTIIRNVPEGTTRSQLVSKLRANGYDTSGLEEEPERTFGGYAKEALKGLIPGAVGLGETAITGAAALLPEEAEEAIRRPVSEFAESVRETFAPAPGYEDTAVRKVSEAVGSTLPFLAAGPFGVAGRIGAAGLGVATGAGEARQRAEEEGATEGERGVATALGTVPGALEALPPIRILRRFGFADEAIEEIAGFVPALQRAAKAGGEEALQEASSQVLQNLIAKGVYAPDEAVFGGIGEAAVLGGGAGAVVSAIADLALGRRLRGARGEEAPPAEEPPATQETAQAPEPPAPAPRRPLGEEDQMSLPLDTEAVQMPLFEEAPAGEPSQSLYRPAEDILAEQDLKPRSRAFKEEARDLGLKLDRKGDLKPNQFVFQQPETEVPLTQGRFEFETPQEQLDLPMTVPPADGQLDMFGAPLPRGGEMQIVPSRPEMPVIEEIPESQLAFNLPGIPMERLAPRDRVLRAMAISEDRKTVDNLKFATQLRPVELKTALNELKSEGIISYKPGKFEWELTPQGVENVRSSAEVKPARPRRGAGVSVPPSGAEAPSITGVGERGVAGASDITAQADVGEAAGQPALKAPTPPAAQPQPPAAPPAQAAPPAPPVDRMALIRRAQEKRVAQQAIGQVTDRRNEFRTQAIDAFESDKISEKTYDIVAEELKKPVPNFARVTSLLEGTAKPKRMGPKFQRVEEPPKAPVYQIVNTRTGQVVGTAKTLKGARLAVDRRDTQYGGYAHKIQVLNPEADIVQRQKLRAELGVEPIEAPAPRTTAFQRGKTGAGLPIERVQAAADDAVRTWTNAPKIVVASSVDDPVIPENIRKQIPEDAPGFYVNETTYILADRAKDESAVRGTVFHESLGHYGLEQEFQGGLQEVMQGIYDTNPKMQAAANERIKKFDLDAATAVEEVLAERSEAGSIKESWLRDAFNRVAAYIRNFMRKRGLVLKYSDNDVNQILRQAHRRVTKLKKTSYDPFNPAVRYQRSPEEQRNGDRRFINAIGKIPQSLPAVTKDTYNSAVDAASKMPSSMRQGLYSMLNLHELDRMYNKYTKALGNWWADVNREGVALRKQQEVIEKNFQKWQKVMDSYSDAEKNRIYKLFMDTTVEQVEVLDLVDPSKNINWVAKKDSPLYRQFQNLKPEVKEFYKELRLSYMDYSLQTEKLLQQYMTPTEWQKMLNDFNKRRLSVYLPLFRKGDYKLTYLDKDGEYVARQFETPNQRRLARLEAQRNGAKDFKESVIGTKEADALPSAGFFGKVVATLEKNKVNKDTQRAIVELYLDYLPTNSVLQLSRRREGTAGFSSNVLEAYANVADSYSRRLVNMEFMPKFNAHNEALKADLMSAVDQNRLDSVVASDLLSTAERQLDYIRNPNMNNLAAKVGYFSYQMYLGANISTAIVNTLDIPTITWSRLGGKYGFGKAFNAIGKATTTFFSKKKSPEMEMLIEQGLNSGVLREQQLQDLAEFKNMGSKYLEMKGRVERLTNWAFAKSDTFNRQVTLAAAYDLAKKTPEGVFDEKAFEQAQRAVYDVYGSSFPKAGPPIMGNQLARTALTFKRFAITRMNLLVSAMREARDIEPDLEVRKAARKELIGYFASAYVFAGVQGMPLVGAGMALVSALNGIFGDDDEPYNPDFALREAITLFNYKGPVNYALGVDIASRTGWTGMFWREDPKRMAEVGPVTYAIEQLLGPAYSYAVGVPRAFDYMENGQYNRAFEQLAPRFMGNVVKGLRYAEEGALTASGKPLVEDVSAYNTFMQIFGFRPSEVAEAGDIAGAAKRAESVVLQRRNAIISRAALARLSGDMDGFQEARDEAIAFNQRNPDFPITGDTLIEAIERRKRNLLQSVNGVNVNPKLARRIYSELGVEEELE